MNFQEYISKRTWELMSENADLAFDDAQDEAFRDWVEVNTTGEEHIYV